MHPVEVQAALDGAVLLLDTREQDTARLRARLTMAALPFERQKLDFGDYSAKFPLPDGSWYDMSRDVAIERKMDLDEICQCYTRERERFQREFDRAKAVNAKIYLLIENATYEQVLSGRYRSRMQPNALAASIFAWLARYDCQILMCKQATSGRLIREILLREGKERLMARE